LALFRLAWKAGADDAATGALALPLSVEPDADRSHHRLPLGALSFHERDEFLGCCGRRHGLLGLELLFQLV